MSTDKQLDFCLLIPCYNNLKGLVQSLKTVTYFADKFSVIIVDDGSDIPISLKIIEGEIRPSYPIKILRSEQNEGITAALNKGLKWIEEKIMARYIARLDCGDLCDDARFYKQMDYMDKHPHASLLGTWCMFENRKTSSKYQYRTPTSHNEIQTAMYFRNVFIHPTVIFKTSMLTKVGYYPAAFPHAEDYAFFWQLLNSGEGHILDEVLVNCELNSEGISIQNRREQLAARARVVEKFGTNFFLKILGTLRLKVLLILPKHLILSLKKLSAR